MNIKRKTILIFLSLIFIVCSNFFGQSNAQDRLYGKVDFISDTINLDRYPKPFDEIKIRIFKMKNNEKDEELCSTYPDSRGYFTFKNVPEGKYYIQISHMAIKKEGFIDEIVFQNKITVKYNSKRRQRLHPIFLELHIPPFAGLSSSPSPRD